MSLKKQIARKTRKYRKAFFNGHLSDVQFLKRLRIAGKERSHPLLNPIFNNTSNIKNGDKLLLTMGKDENKRIPYFLEYYRSLGINHFLFIDNDSVIPMSEHLTGMSDVSLWHTKDSYAGSQYGVDWMNALNSKYSIGHWALTVDLDEFFVFPLMEKRSLNELCLYLDTVEQPSLFAPLIDLYPNGKISEATVPNGINPLVYANHFDAAGYRAVKGGYGDTWLRGGPRCRVFNKGQIADSPTLNKTPLIKWDSETLYFFSTHTAYPTHLNKVHHNDVSSVTGALLHFKFISDMKEKAEYAVANGNHYENSKEYKIYLKTLEENENLNLMCPYSIKYEDSSTLTKLKLMNSGIWGEL